MLLACIKHNPPESTEMHMCLTVRRELEETGHFECMDLNTDEEEHSIEMQLPFIAKVMEGYVLIYKLIPNQKYRKLY